MGTMTRLASMAVGLVGFGLVGTDARAGDVMYAANFCTPVIADINRVQHGPQFGVNNVSNVTATVRCPFNPPFAAFVDRVEVTVYDRNPATNVSCTLLGIDSTGATFFSQTRNSIGSSGPPQLLEFSMGGFTHTMTMTCTIPAASGGRLSHITTYREITFP